MESNVNVDLQMLTDAAIVVDEDGVISAVHDMNDDGAEETMADLMAQGVELADFRGKLIMPGFIDGHAHAPQVVGRVMCHFLVVLMSIFESRFGTDVGKMFI